MAVARTLWADAEPAAQRSAAVRWADNSPAEIAGEARPGLLLAHKARPARSRWKNRQTFHLVFVPFFQVAFLSGGGLGTGRTHQPHFDEKEEGSDEMDSEELEELYQIAVKERPDNVELMFQKLMEQAMTRRDKNVKQELMMHSS